MQAEISKLAWPRGSHPVCSTRVYNVLAYFYADYFDAGTPDSKKNRLHFFTPNFSGKYGRFHGNAYKVNTTFRPGKLGSGLEEGFCCWMQSRRECLRHRIRLEEVQVHEHNKLRSWKRVHSRSQSRTLRCVFQTSKKKKKKNAKFAAKEDFRHLGMIPRRCMTKIEAASRQCDPACW